MSLGALSGLNPGVSLVCFYTLAYVMLVCMAVFLLGALPLCRLKHTNGVMVSAMLSVFRLRWVWLLVIVNLAGLPPAFFFGPKLGLLALFLDAGLFPLSMALGVSIFLG